MNELLSTWREEPSPPPRGYRPLQLSCRCASEACEETARRCPSGAGWTGRSLRTPARRRGQGRRDAPARNARAYGGESSDPSRQSLRSRGRSRPWRSAQLAFVPDAKGVVGEQAGAAPAARLRVDEHRVDGERIDLPLPPVAALAPDAVDGRQSFQHQAFDAPVA